jgi:hypothetical protein
VQSVLGDFNSDGTVDAADYVVWRNGVGSTYTQTDYDVWRAHFGQTAGSSAVQVGVPEPNTLAVHCLGLLPLFASRRGQMACARHRRLGR